MHPGADAADTVYCISPFSGFFQQNVKSTQRETAEDKIVR
jgi:hypothetical protein